MNGSQSVSIGPVPLAGTLDFAKGMKGQPFTIACWLKTRSNPFMGGYLNVEGIVGTEFVQGTLRLNMARVLNDGWPSSMLSSWTHLAFTYDGSQLCAYRNGILISSAPVSDGTKIAWGRKFSLGGKSPYGDAEVAAQSIYFYSTALSLEAVNDLHLWGKFQPKRE
jgi:hypothetical protein